MVDNKLVSIFSGRESKYLAEKIAKNYGTKLGETKFTQFSDGEFQVSFEENIRGRDVFLIQSTFAPTDNLFELLLMIDAAKRASAKNIVVVIPYFGFARQDRKDRPRVSIAAKLIADLLSNVPFFVKRKEPGVYDLCILLYLSILIRTPINVFNGI